MRFFYALMDGGYSSGDIRYRGMTTVERTNRELKDCFLPPKLYSRGSKAILDIKLAVLLLTMKKIRKAVMMLEERKTA